MNIGSGSGWPSSTLSNFAPHSFILSEVECASMEGFLQSLKFDKVHIQDEVCRLVGRAAKFRGKKRNRAWQSKQVLWWRGVPFQRQSPGYQQLLDRAFTALNKNTGFRRALEATDSAVLRHTLGSRDETKTVLTEAEFVSRLTRLRDTGTL